MNSSINYGDWMQNYEYFRNNYYHLNYHHITSLTSVLIIKVLNYCFHDFLTFSINSSESLLTTGSQH